MRTYKEALLMGQMMDLKQFICIALLTVGERQKNEILKEAINFNHAFLKEHGYSSTSNDKGKDTEQK